MIFFPDIPNDNWQEGPSVMMLKALIVEQLDADGTLRTFRMSTFT
jgi:hypothetical protein